MVFFFFCLYVIYKIYYYLKILKCFCLWIVLILLEGIGIDIFGIFEGNFGISVFFVLFFEIKVGIIM